MISACNRAQDNQLSETTGKNYACVLLRRMQSIFTIDGLKNMLDIPPGGPYKRCVCLCDQNIKKYMGILKSLNIVNLYRVC